MGLEELDSPGSLGGKKEGKEKGRRSRNKRRSLPNMHLRRLDQLSCTEAAAHLGWFRAYLKPDH